MKLDKKLEEYYKQKEYYLMDVINSYNINPKKKIKLNIGGVKYETTLQTLLKYPLSFFSILFGGNYLPEKDEEGYFFIDRNGELFKDVLEFLRTGKTPKNMSDELENEFIYYNLLEYTLNNLDKSFDLEYYTCKYDIYVNNYFNNNIKKCIINKICLNNDTLILSYDNNFQTVPIENFMIKLYKKDYQEIDIIDYPNIDRLDIFIIIYLFNGYNFINIGKGMLVGSVNNNSVIIDFRNNFYLINLNEKTMIINNYPKISFII